jgi:hypothetical protein
MREVEVVIDYVPLVCQMDEIGLASVMVRGTNYDIMTMLTDKAWLAIRNAAENKLQEESNG